MYVKASSRLGRLSGTPGEHANDFQFYLEAGESALRRKTLPEDRREGRRVCESDMLKVFEAERHFARAEISLTYAAGAEAMSDKGQAARTKQQRALREFEVKLRDAESSAMRCLRQGPPIPIRKKRRKR